jgi:prepilin-type N-terminal cleavage/methylation domain-containing protein
MTRSKHLTQGFTLAELLVSLLILGEIATFTIPKILSSQQNGMKKVILKETVATLEQIKYKEIDIGGSTASSTNVFLDNINAVKVCKTNSQTEGCYSYDTYPGALLHNGAVIASFDGWTAWGGPGCEVDGIIIDWNGNTGPNTVGDDKLAIIINRSAYTCYDVLPRRISASLNWGNLANQALWESLWKS